MPPVGILGLPLELLYKITEDRAISPNDILNLRYVNKTFYDLATPLAFREIVVLTKEKSVQGFMDLLVNTDLSKYVRVLQIIEDDSEEFKTESDGDEAYKRVGSRLRRACSMLHLIPTLESLVIWFVKDEDYWVRPYTYHDKLERYQLLQWDVFKGLTCNPNPLPALKSLEIDNWFACTNEIYESAPFERIISSLRDLRFCVQDTEYESHDINVLTEDFWPKVIGLRVLQLAVNLTSLAMESSERFGSLVRLDLSSITFPCLTSLSLSNFVWDDVRVDPQVVVPEAENFIVRHGKTLKKLKLCRCDICLLHDWSTPVRSWAAVWNRFAEELTELVDLDVDGSFYTFYLPEGFGFKSTSHIRGKEQDTPALEVLATMVKERMALASLNNDY